MRTCWNENDRQVRGKRQLAVFPTGGLPGMVVHATETPTQVPFTGWGTHSPAAAACDVLEPLLLVQGMPWRQLRSGCRGAFR